MKALTWHGTNDIRCEEVPEPKIEHPRDAIIKVTSCAICGSDLHLYHNYIPQMKAGDIVGHEFMGEVMEVGAENKRLKVGDRVVIPFTICCGECEQCLRGNFSVCETTNREGEKADLMFGHRGAGLFGYSHITGGYPGGQAQYVRAPYSDATAIKVPSTLTDEQVLFLGDIFPTGWQAAVACDIQPTDTVAIWGCGPVGQMTIRSAVLLGAQTVIAIDNIPERLEMARAGGAVTIDFSKENVVERLNDMTRGRGPEKCIDAVGMEAHATSSIDAIYDKVKMAMMLVTDRIHVLREMIYVCRPAGIISVPGVYGGIADKIPIGALMNKGLTLRTGQTHVNRWADDLLRRIEEGQIDPSFVITHTVSIEDGPRMYEVFEKKEDGCIKVVVKP